MDSFNFSTEELLAGLEAPQRQPQRPESIAAANEIERAMQELTRMHETNSSPNVLQHATANQRPSRAGPPGSIKRQAGTKPKLERVESITGRPEEFFQTLKRKKPQKGHTLQVGNYQLGEKLGKGAFGTVYKGLDLKTGQFVAVKRISREMIDGDHMMKEINFLKTFNHKNIVKYVGLVQTEKHLNLVLEYVDSGSLAQVLSGYGFFPESLAAIYIAQVLDGLCYLHRQQVIHRDIKGGNLLITRDGSIKVADFGIATVASTNQRHSLVEGSPYWMAPEVIEMSCNPTTASDIWSLGCTLIELLTGFPPYFELVAVTAIYRMVQDTHPPLPDDISPELEDFLRQCFRKQPDQRPTARVLRSHNWIKKHVPDSTESNMLNVDQMRQSIKRYTMNKESGSKLKENLAKMALEEASSSEEFLPVLSSKSTESITSETSEEEVKDTKKTAGRKNSLFRKKKDKRAGLNMDPDAPLILNIYSVETRRNIFTFTIYHVRIVKKSTNETWDIERTWSDFKELHTQLSNNFPQIKLPTCPQKKFWGVMDPDFVRKRWQELQQYLTDLVKIAEIRDSSIFGHFITPQP